MNNLQDASKEVGTKELGAKEACSKDTSKRQGITVDIPKLNRGLKTTFTGIAMIFDSVGADVEMDAMFESQEVLTSPQRLLDGVKGTSEEQVSSLAHAESSSGDGNDTGDEMSVNEIAVPIQEQPNKSKQPEHYEPKEPQEPQGAQSATQTASEAPIASGASSVPASPAPSTLTLDDITKVIVNKIKQNRSNNEKIEKLVHDFGVQSVKLIPPKKYEAFMTELAAI